MLRSVFLCLAVLLLAAPAAACTNLLVTPGASTDNSSFITYTCDGVFHATLRRQDAADHEPGTMYEIRHWDGSIHGELPQVAHTYAYVNLMNEHQVAIGETTFDGRLELQNTGAMLHYWTLMKLALERSRTAREAVEVITSLVEEFGYRSTGESFSICDPREVWILEMIGSGADDIGAVWVARRLPDGTVSAHANMARIGEFPTGDKHTLYSANVFEVAIRNGWYDHAGEAPFNFRDVYDPATPQKKRYTATRVWSLLRRAAPSLELSPDFHRGVPGTIDYPLWVKPDEKIDLDGVRALMRDHYEDTAFDMTAGVDAGPFGNPNRWRPMSFEMDGGQFTWERPISTQQTGFSIIAQCRRDLPDPVGGCLWYGVDDTYTTVWTPLYAGVTEIPAAYARGGLGEFSWDSAEDDLTAMQPAVEHTARDLYKRDPELAAQYLTTYSVSTGERVFERWRELAGALITRYNDGYVRTDGRATEVGYKESWLRDVLRLRPEQFRLPVDQPDSLQTDLPY